MDVSGTIFSDIINYATGVQARYMNVRNRIIQLRRQNSQARAARQINQIAQVTLQVPQVKLLYFSAKKWLLIECPDEFQNFFIGCKYGFSNAYKKLQVERAKQNPFPMTTLQFHISQSIFTMSDEKAQAIENLMYKNQKFRWQMKHLIHRWSLQRLKEINKDDIVTCELPKKPVTIYDWDNRCKYVLEASTIYRDFREKIFKASGLITNSQLPKNPFTNQTYSFGQLHFIIEALQRNGYTDWALQGLKAQGYNLPKFKTIYRDAIGIEVLHRCFSDPTSDGCVDTVFDFITMEYNYHGFSTVSDDVWYWFLEKKPDFPIIQEWRKICFKFYENPAIQYNQFDHTQTRALVLTPLGIMNQIYYSEQG